MSAYQVGRVPRIFQGGDVTDRLRKSIDRIDPKSVVFVVDSGVQATGYVQRLQDAVAPLTTAVHAIPPGEPTFATVDAAADFARSFETPAIVGVGGGSALDTAKQVAAVISGSDPISHYALARNPFVGRAPLISIPTTAGTGSEVTRTCVVTDDSGRKVWTWDDALLPDTVILDPEATITMPPPVTAGTGLDAVVHALEACTGQRRNAISAASGLHALRLARTHLPIVAREPENIESRKAMQEAALLAGIAIDGAGTGIGHCIGHALGGLYHIPHGVAVALSMEATLTWSVAGREDQFAEAAAALGVKPSDVPSDFRKLLSELNFRDIVRDLDEHEVEPSEISTAMASEANQPMLNNNARVPTAVERADLARRTAQVWAAHRA